MSALVSPSIESLLPYEGGKPVEELARELGITDAIKLASNENPLGPSPKAIAAARAVLNDVHRYPDANAFKLRERIELSKGGRQLLQGRLGEELNVDLAEESGRLGIDLQQIVTFGDLVRMAKTLSAVKTPGVSVTPQSA